MVEIRTRHLMSFKLDVAGVHRSGATPNGNLRIGLIGSGRFEGERLRGTILPGSGTMLDRPDGSTIHDVRPILQTDDGATIVMPYRGFRHGPPEIIEKVDRGEPADPSSYYFRTAVFFETGAAKYDWLNRIVAIGTGYRSPEGPVYEVFEVL